MLSRITRALLRTPRTSLAILLGMLLVLAFIGSHIAIDPSFDSLISPQGEYNSNARVLEAAFGTNNAFSVVFLLDETSSLSSRLSTLDAQSLNVSTQQIRTLLDESQYVRSVGGLEISQSQRQARISVQVFEPNTEGGSALVREELESLVAQASPPLGVEIEVTGFPVIINRINTLLISDNLRTVVFTALLVFLVLLWYFRDLKVAGIGLLSPLVSLGSLAGVMVFLDIPITLTLAAVGVIVVGLGADYSIHLITTYSRKLREGLSGQQAILKSLDELELALSASFLTTVAGFAALMLGVSPSSQAQGVVLVVAITAIFVVTMLLLPLLLVVFIKQAPEGGRQAIGFMDGLFSKLAHLQVEKPYMVLAVLAIATLVFVFGASQVNFSTSNSNWIPDDDPVALTFSEIETSFGSTEAVTILVQSTRGDLRDVQTVRDIQLLEQKLRGIPEAVSVSSPFSETARNRASIFEDASEHAQAFNADFTLTTIRVVTEGIVVEESGNSRLLLELDDILGSTPIYQAQTSIFGDIVRFSELGESLQQDAALTTLSGFLLVFVIASVIYASLVVGTVALVPILIAVVWAVGLMGFFGVPFTSLSTGIVSLMLGIGVDFSIHLVNSLRLARQETDNLVTAVERSLQTTGGAIFLSSITTFFGFSALTLATLLGTQRLGWSLAFSILCIFVVAMVLVPTVVILRERIWKRST